MLFRGLAGLVLCLSSGLIFALESFEVKDIRVEGIQRVEAGTVFSYLPVKVGDTVDDERATSAIKALYATGFFSDVRLEQDNNVLVVIVQERPAIGQIDITGAKDLAEKDLKESLKGIGLAESRTYDKSVLDRAEKELRNQYLARGRYAAQVSSVVTPLERNRVAIAINIEEGDVAKIRAINITGNKAFREKELLSLFQLTTPSYLTWLTRNDQYSKQKLSADLENLRSFYLDQGYLEFTIDSTQVQITPDKQEIYIAVPITEGPRYKVSEVKIAPKGEVNEANLKSMLTIKAGDEFSRARLTESTKRIGDSLANDGYSFASVNAIPDVDKEKQTVSYTLQVDPGKRVYVRRINVIGNIKTRDEVIRREMRQMEGGWFSAEKIARSKERIDRLGFFSEVNIETPPVSGTNDQVDVNVSVVERSTGNIQIGAGYSNSDRLVITGSISQANAFGTGNQLSAQISTGAINRTISFSFTDPYYTEDGVSRGFDIYQKNVDVEKLSGVAPYRTRSIGGDLRYGIPVTETDAINLGFGYDRTRLTLFDDSSNQFKEFQQQFGSDYTTFKSELGWSRDSRDSIFYPTKGRTQRVYAEVGLPGGDLTYYRLTYSHQWLYPVTDAVTVSLGGELSYADGYRNKELPFFKNYFAGGVSTVRGFRTSSLGPKDENGDAIGGNRRIVGNFEVLFPLPGTKRDKATRLSLFADVGNVYGKGEKLDLGTLRYSGGVGLAWYSPIGPLKLSFGVPLKKESGDKLERFQFLLGTVF